jgi:hypothetical protein
MTHPLLHITSRICIRGGIITLNGKQLLKKPVQEPGAFLREAYDLCAISYPKFFKMDNLCKLAFVGAELLQKETPFREKYDDTRKSLILQNSSSSLDTDIKHIQSIENRDAYFPSPSVFVYTLPNIAAGEICIRHRIKGYTAFFIFEGFEPEFLFEQVSRRFQKNETDACICGITEFMGNQYEACLFMVEKTQQGIPFTMENMKTTYTNT